MELKIIIYINFSFNIIRRFKSSGVKISVSPIPLTRWSSLQHCRRYLAASDNNCSEIVYTSLKLLGPDTVLCVVYGQKTTGQKTTKNANPGQETTIVENL